MSMRDMWREERDATYLNIDTHICLRDLPLPSISYALNNFFVLYLHLFIDSKNSSTRLSIHIPSSSSSPPRFCFHTHKLLRFFSHSFRLVAYAQKLLSIIEDSFSDKLDDDAVFMIPKDMNKVR